MAAIEPALSRGHAADRSTALSYASEFLPAVVDGIHLFQGVTDTTLSHGEGWQFIQIGRYIERASSTARLLEVYHHDSKSPDEAHDAFDYLEWIGLLRTCTAFEGYCKVYTADLTYARILEFLVLDADFPHSIRFCIDSLVNSLRAVEQDGRGHHAEEHETLGAFAGILSATGRCQKYWSAMPGFICARSLIGACRSMN